jgi:hypothetical protein
MKGLAALKFLFKGCQAARPDDFVGRCQVDEVRRVGDDRAEAGSIQKGVSAAQVIRA